MIQKKYRLTWKKHVSVFMLAALTLSSTGLDTAALAKVSAAAQTDSEKFDEYGKECFKQALSSSLIENNFGVIDGSIYGVTEVPNVFSSYSKENVERTIQNNKEINSFLDTLAYRNLTKEQQDLYDLIRFETKYALDDEKYQYYAKAFGAYSGLQTDLITTLTAFRFDEREDFINYLEMLKTVPKCFEDAITYEQVRSEKGLFISDHELDEVLQSIKDLISDPEHHVLIEAFNHTVDKFDLNNRDKQRFKKANHDLVINEIIPAYKNAAKELEKLRGTGIANDTGIWALPNGKEYYEHLLHYYTGTERSPMEYVKIFDQLSESAVTEIKEIVAKANVENFKAPSKKFVEAKPEELLPLLVENTEQFVTPIKDVKFNIKYVDEALGTFAAPAYVMKPQIDELKEFDVNFNPAYQGSTDITTVAHESYPGHLYQFITLNLAKKNPLYHVFQNYGYVESWSQQAENNALYFTDCSDNYARYMKLTKDYLLFTQFGLDILINYCGYTKAHAVKYIQSKLAVDTESAETLYYHLLNVPAYNMCYTGGYAELQLLIQHAQEELGDKYNTREFNDFYLAQSCVTFDTIRKNLDEWIKTKKM